MSRDFRNSRIRLALVLGLAAVSCGKSPTSPGASGGAQQPTVVRIEVVAPSAIAPGASAQLTARAIKSDGASDDVTSRVLWSSSDSAVLEVSPAGLATVVARGEVIVTARLDSRTGSARILAIPPGTFKLTGQITEAGFPIDRAEVQVVSGTGQGLTAITAPDGSYALYGVAGHVRLRASKADYFSKIEELEVLEHRTFNFEMTPEGGRPNLSGTYTLLIIGRCGSILPAELGTRTYAASVEQRGPGLTVMLSGADFIISRGRGDRFQGVMDSDGRITFTIGDPLGYSYYGYYYYYSYPVLMGQPDLAERIAPSGALVINGTVDAAVSGSRINGTLTGAFLFTDQFTAAELTPAIRFNKTCFSSFSAFQMRKH
jgi:hypothetical protein